jgi:hypothetical protein
MPNVRASLQQAQKARKARDVRKDFMDFVNRDETSFYGEICGRMHLNTL